MAFLPAFVCLMASSFGLLAIGLPPPTRLFHCLGKMSNTGTSQNSMAIMFVGLSLPLKAALTTCEFIFPLFVLLFNVFLAISIVPGGTPHWVGSVEFPDRRPVSILQWGDHFMSRHTMTRTLYASIGHAFWHDCWTNAQHDDRDFSIAKMLVWQALHEPSSSDAPFQGDNLFALIMMGRLSHLLRGLPLTNPPKEGGSSWLEVFEPTNPTSLSGLSKAQIAEFAVLPARLFLESVRSYMWDVAGYLIARLNEEERRAFVVFWADVRSFFEVEFHKRAEYNKTR